MNYNLQIHNNLASELQGNKVLIITVYSMRDYETGLYDLNCDGNFHIVMNLLSLLDETTQITLTMPPRSLCKSWAGPRVNYTPHLNCEIEFLSCEAYGKNAQQTRLNKEGWESFLNNEDLQQYDLILFSPQTCYPTLEKLDRPLIYWMYHSRTESYNPEYLHPVNAWDKYIAEHCRTFVASYNQLQYGSDLEIDNAWYNTEYMNKVYKTFLKEAAPPFPSPTIFIPFRQNHAGYRLPELFAALAELEDAFIILYSAPNGVVIDELPDYALHVKLDKATYINTLRRKPLIPLLENVDDLLHYSMYEFAHLGAKVLTLPNQHSKAKEDVLNMDHMDWLKDSLKHIHRLWHTL